MVQPTQEAINAIHTKPRSFLSMDLPLPNEQHAVGLQVNGS
jgi:hypothetical protein